MVFRQGIEGVEVLQVGCYNCVGYDLFGCTDENDVIITSVIGIAVHQIM